MKNEKKIYITANELSKILGISEGHAYKIIRKLNKELENQGYIIITGKLPVAYFENRWYGHGA